MVPPPPPAPPAPDTQLSLEWVYGYSAASCRASACYVSAAGGNTTAAAGAEGVCGGGGGVGVVFPAGKVAVVLSQPLDEEGAEVEGERVQSFMQEHTDEITSLAVSPCGKWVATGEAGAHPKVSDGAPLRCLSPRNDVYSGVRGVPPFDIAQHILQH